MSDRTGAFVFVGAAIAVLVATMLYEAFRPLPEPPLPVVIERESPTIEDCIVNVYAIEDGQRRYGKGVVIEHKGITFVLTSQMIFVGNFEEIGLEFGENWTVRGELLSTDSVWGLAAIACEPGFNEGYEISEAPNLPPWTESNATTEKGQTPVKVLAYTHDNWFLVTGIDENYVGAPLVNGKDITGIIIGVNSADTQQAIVAGNRAINEFVDSLGGDE
jgi:hypothetical protein